MPTINNHLDTMYTSVTDKMEANKQVLPKSHGPRRNQCPNTPQTKMPSVKCSHGKTSFGSLFEK